MSSSRIEKVNSLLEHEIAAIVSRDFKFSGSLVSVTHVDATANLIEAKAYISVMFTRQSIGDGGPEERAQKIIDALNAKVYDIQQQINKKLKMRPIPKIMFVADTKIQEAARIEELLEKIKNPDIRNNDGHVAK